MAIKAEIIIMIRLVVGAAVTEESLIKCRLIVLVKLSYR